MSKLLHTYAGVLLVGAGIVGIWRLLVWYGVKVGDPADTHLELLLGVGYGLAALVMLVFSTAFNIRSIGQFYTYLADAVFWGVLGASKEGWLGLTSGLLMWLRALFIGGIVCLILGLLVFLGGIFCRFIRRHTYPINPGARADSLWRFLWRKASKASISVPTVPANLGDKRS